MARTVRLTNPLVPVLAAAHNDLKAQIGAGAAFHLDKSESTVGLPDASDLTSALALVNRCRQVYDGTGSAFTAYPGHRHDLLAHRVADVANGCVSPRAIDLATGCTAATEMKGKFDAHLTQAGVHYTNDTTNSVGAVPDATTLPSLITLATALKAALNAHLGSGPLAASLRVIPA